MLSIYDICFADVVRHVFVPQNNIDAFYCTPSYMKVTEWLCNPQSSKKKKFNEFAE